MCHTVFGFLGGKEVQEAGLGNLGLYDRECIYTQTKIWRLFVIQNEWPSNGYRNTSQSLAEILEKQLCKTSSSSAINSLALCMSSWGESAGAISVMSQIVAYDGNVNGLFRGAVMVCLRCWFIFSI